MTFFPALGTAHSTPADLPGPKNPFIYAQKAWKINLATHCSVSQGTRQLVYKQYKIHQSMKGACIPTYTVQAFGAKCKDLHRPPTLTEKSATPG